ncbi:MULTISPECIES: helix-turn-helix domain-containing protein [Clostridium]|uniref:helix-turn-helix domain-containing protein n=1 Tax=Clostridium TaxID=1485 RepID=UPI00242D0D3E|nr:helix-turn-helix domain-containing protein [Clostridium tyrobutyricum]
MSKKCYFCNTEMEKKIISVNAGWGTYKLTIDGVNAYVCPKCGEFTIEGKDAIMLQKLSKSLANAEEEQKPDILNLTEVADLLRVSNQTIYNMIRDGRLKAHKFGREWRFLRNDIESLMSKEETYGIATMGKAKKPNEENAEIIFHP